MYFLWIANFKQKWGGEDRYLAAHKIQTSLSDILLSTTSICEVPIALLVLQKILKKERSRHCNTLPASDSAPDLHISRASNGHPFGTRAKTLNLGPPVSKILLIFLEGRGSLTTVRNFRLFPVVSLSPPKLLLYSGGGLLFPFFFFGPLIFLFLILVGLHQSLDPTSRAKSITLEISPFG